MGLHLLSLVTRLVSRTALRAVLQASGAYRRDLRPSPLAYRLVTRYAVIQYRQALRNFDKKGGHLHE